jgi:hypothetical protein
MSVGPSSSCCHRQGMSTSSSSGLTQLLECAKWWHLVKSILWGSYISFRSWFWWIFQGFLDWGVGPWNEEVGSFLWSCFLNQPIWGDVWIFEWPGCALWGNGMFLVKCSECVCVYRIRARRSSDVLGSFERLRPSLPLSLWHWWWLCRGVIMARLFYASAD